MVECLRCRLIISVHVGTKGLTPAGNVSFITADPVLNVASSIPHSVATLLAVNMLSPVINFKVTPAPIQSFKAFFTPGRSELLKPTKPSRISVGGLEVKNSSIDIFLCAKAMQRRPSFAIPSIVCSNSSLSILFMALTIPVVSPSAGTRSPGIKKTTSPTTTLDIGIRCDWPCLTTSTCGIMLLALDSFWNCLSGQKLLIAEMIIIARTAARAIAPFFHPSLRPSFLMPKPIERRAQLRRMRIIGSMRASKANSENVFAAGCFFPYTFEPKAFSLLLMSSSSPLIPSSTLVSSAVATPATPPSSSRDL
ncbi:hypothetical protein RJ640_011479 [Escallonia rubra]|uniref:Uncharacterized protein n=1 Tax=Escallonia rubra TaxID=112253 RepID=A0AA88UFZ9_9ASTE|nr:hypothetical protein RJ640_011479 [Escallonia rubra]